MSFPGAEDLLGGPNNPREPRELPPATAQPCSDCPWRRCSAPGWLGPHDAQTWLDAVRGEEPIACHQTIVVAEGETGNWTHPSIRQCRGAAIFRTNIGKMPRAHDVARGPADREAIFATTFEFLEHHEP